MGCLSASGKPLGGLGATQLVEVSGVKVGIVGLVEKEWITTLATLDENDVDYIDFVIEGRRQALLLKEEGADLVIALTHMREANDRLLLQAVAGVDIVCGGHDHSYQVCVSGHAMKTKEMKATSCVDEFPWNWQIIDQS